MRIHARRGRGGRRQFIKNALALSITSLLRPAWGRNPRGYPAAVVAPSGNYIGMNTTQLAYYSSEIPFLDVLKQATSNYPGCAWSTNVSTQASSMDLVLDSNGFCTSLTGASGTLYTYVRLGVFFNVNNGSANPVPGLNTSQLYPAGPYTLSITGAYTITFGGNVTAVSVISGSVTGSGLTWTCSGGTAVFSLTMGGGTTNTGFYLQFSNFTSASYPKPMYCVPTSQLSNYNAGQICSPQFAAFMAPFSRLRTMKWCQTNNQVQKMVFTTPPTAGTNVSMTISEWYTTGSPSGGDSTTWTLQTGTYSFVLNDGTTVLGNCTYGSGTVVLQTVGASQSSATAYWISQPGWSARSLPSNMTWAGTNGPSLDVLIAICNQLNVDLEYAIPISRATDSTFITNVANMIYSGTGATITQAQSGLKSTLKAWISCANEEWNAGYFDGSYASILAAIQFSGSPGYLQNSYWFGAAVAGIGDTFAGVFGSSMASRVKVLVGCQFAWTSADGYASNGPYYASARMNTQGWTSAAYTHHIAGISFAPYINVGGITSGDITTLLASTNPLNSWFDLAYAQTDRYGTNYPSMATSGWLGSTIATATSLITALSSTTGTGSPPYGAGNGVWGPGGSAPVEIIAYEAGTQWQNQPSAFQAFLYTALRDNRMQYVYYDPGHVLSSNPGYYPSMIAAGFTNLNHFADVGFLQSNSTCVAAESVMQTLSPLSSAPPIYQGLANYAAA